MDLTRPAFRRRATTLSALCLALLFPAASLFAAMGPEIRITRTATPVVVDGDLSDPIWKTAEPITDWLETNPGDNIPPK